MSRRRVTVDTPPLALRRAEAAAACGVSAEQFDTYIRPYLPCIRLGAVVIYRTSDIDRWLEQNASSPVHDLGERRRSA